MRFLLLLITISAVLPFEAAAQQFHGRAYDAMSSAPVATVLITNTRSGAMWVSDSSGGVVFTAYPGDVVTFSHPAYKVYKIKIATYQDDVSVGLERAPVQLEEVKVESPMVRFSRDSAFNRQYFRKELGYAGPQVKLETQGGIGASGLISELVLGLSGKKKYYKRFAEEMAMLEELRYAGIRYTPGLVSSLTGLDDSAATFFIARHPIPADFVRVASELELKQWVREQYRAQQKADSAGAPQQPARTETFDRPAARRDSVATER
jgi:hypothetical protein